MQIGRVDGSVVSTAKEPSLEGRKLLIVRFLDVNAKETGDYVVAIDAVNAGAGDVVLIATGSSARLTEVTKDRPSDAVIIAIIDSWDIGGDVKWRKSDGA